MERNTNAINLMETPNNIIELMETPIEKLDISEGLYRHLKQKRLDNLYIIILGECNFDYARYYLSDSHDAELLVFLNKLGLGTYDRKLYKKYIEEYENEKTKIGKTKTITDILNTKILELYFKGKLGTDYKQSIILQRWNNLYQVVKYYEIIMKEYEIRLFKKENIEDLRKVFKEYGINIDKETERKQIIEEYEKELEKPQEIDLLDKTIYEMQVEKGLFIRTFRELACAGLFRIIDILEMGPQNISELRGFGKKSYEQIKITLGEYGINLEDNKQRIKLIEQYRNKTIKSNNDIYDNILYTSQQLKLITNSPESQQLKMLNKEKEILENEYTQKQRLLKDIKQTITKTKSLKEQIYACDVKLRELIEEYNSYGVKERGNSYAK